MSRSGPARSESRWQGSARRAVAAERGYTFVALVVFLVVLNIGLAVAMPLWSKVVQREQEAELVFRGLQYAEAIRVFQARFGRPPNNLDELLELEPRSIRQLWKDPLSESGEWEPLLAGAGSPGRGRDLARTDMPGETGGTDAGERSSDSIGGRERRAARPGAVPGLSGSDREGQSGPIEGVKPTARGEAMRSFLGRTSYEGWEFRSQMFADPHVTPEGVPLSPRIDPDGLGRPFPPWLPSPPQNPLDGGADRQDQEDDGNERETEREND